MRHGRRRRWSSWSAAWLLAAAVLTSCAGPPSDTEPWDRPVDGAAGVTEWEDNGTPTSPFGPDGVEWSSPDDLMDALVASIEQSGVTTDHAVVPGDDADVVTGWVRISDLGEDAALAGDLRLRIERANGSWAVTRSEQRQHCRLAPRDGTCPEPGRPSPAETSAPVESAAPSATTAASGAVYLALGDSVTFGIGVPRPVENGFVARVADALAASERPIGDTRIFAVPGETAAGFRDRRLDDVLTAIGELGPRIELVTVGLGANEVLLVRREAACVQQPDGDACRALVDVAAGAAADALDTIIGAVGDALASHGSSARILVLAYYNPDLQPVAIETIVGSDGGVACDPAERRPGLDDRIACVAEARDATVVNLHAAFLGRELELTRIGEGDVHPNAAGYQAIADAVVEAVLTR
jgi:lysophospholipase L1-like esterase